jgi:hypothetical protein
VTEPSPTRAAGAGLMLVVTIVGCAAVGLGIGALLGAPGPLAGLGGFVGLFVGFAVVYSRFKDL